jgi:hypothetical protein
MFFLSPSGPALIPRCELTIGALVPSYFGFVVFDFWFKLRTAEYFGIQPRDEASAPNSDNSGLHNSETPSRFRAS